MYFMWTYFFKGFQMAAPRQRRRANIESPHRLDDGGVTLSPEAIRQMGIAISAAAARTGARINPADPQLHHAISTLLGTSGLERLARGDTAVLGIVDRFVGEHATIIAQHQRERDAHNPAHTDPATPGSGENLTQRLLRIGAYGRTADDARDRPPGYSDLPGARIAGNADISGISMANYFTSPITRSLVGMGMNYTTFNYMLSEGFNRTHILHAAQDTRRHGFNVNDRGVVRDFGLVNQHDGARRTERNDLLDRYRAALRDDADLRRLREQRERATGEERAKIDTEIRERDRVIRQRLGIGEFIQQTPAQAQEADQRIFNQTFTNEMGIGRDLRLQAGPEGVAEAIITPPPPPAQLPPVTGQEQATADAAAARTEAQRIAELAALRGPQQPAAAGPVVQPPAAGDRRLVVQLPDNTPQGPT